MKTIECQADLDGLRESGLLPEPFYRAVAAYFRQLAEAEGGDIGQDEMVLTDGHIVVIEPSDGSDELRPLLESWPEFGELLSFDQTEVIKIVVMEDNDYIVTWFVERGIHPPIDDWIEPHFETE